MSMMKMLSYADLVQVGVVNNRTQLSRLVKNYDFPTGFLISANARRWFEEDVVEWVGTRNNNDRCEVEDA
jgi:predicted DNA-binding transcriptional regulator AlpA